MRESLLRGLAELPSLPKDVLQTAALAVTSEELSETLFRAAHEPKAIWRIPESGHVGGLDARPREYERRVVGFFDRQLLGE